MLLLPVNTDQFLKSYYKHATCQQLPTNCSGTLGKGLWFVWVGTTIQIRVPQEEDKNPKQKEVNTNLSYETERK